MHQNSGYEEYLGNKISQKETYTFILKEKNIFWLKRQGESQGGVFKKLENGSNQNHESRWRKEEQMEADSQHKEEDRKDKSNNGESVHPWLSTTEEEGVELHHEAEFWESVLARCGFHLGAKRVIFLFGLLGSLSCGQLFFVYSNQ